MKKEPVSGVQLDLKYFMPSKAFLMDWVRELPNLGINTLLLEYEDKFPFRKYPFLRAPGAFTEPELKAFLAAARGAGLRVVPLVQTLSHLEFALAHPELAALRELPDIPTQICPLNPAAVRFVEDLHDEVLAFHEEDEWFHLAADEAWSLGACPACRDWLGGKPHSALWSHHVNRFVERIVAKGKRPLVWDDTFWKRPDDVAGLHPAAIPASWAYHITRERPGGFLACMSTYKKHGFPVLGTSCCNWGIFFPQHLCLKNIEAWGDINNRVGGGGILNSAWACFHMPLAMYPMQIAATRDAVENRLPLDRDWEAAFLEKRYGTKAARLPEALHRLGELWEIKVPGLGRPLTPVDYGYMDMVAWFKGGVPERQKRGAYPLDWSEIDFQALHRDKIARIRALSNRAEILAKAGTTARELAAAARILKAWAGKTRKNRDEAALWTALADLKAVAAAVFLFELGGPGRKETLSGKWDALGQTLNRLLPAFYEPSSAARWKSVFHTPVAAALEND